MALVMHLVYMGHFQNNQFQVNVLKLPNISCNLQVKKRQFWKKIIAVIMKKKNF